MELVTVISIIASIAVAVIVVISTGVKIVNAWDRITNCLKHSENQRVRDKAELKEDILDVKSSMHEYIERLSRRIDRHEEFHHFKK